MSTNTLEPQPAATTNLALLTRAIKKLGVLLAISVAPLLLVGAGSTRLKPGPEQRSERAEARARAVRAMRDWLQMEILLANDGARGQEGRQGRPTRRHGKGS